MLKDWKELSSADAHDLVTISDDLPSIRESKVDTSDTNVWRASRRLNFRAHNIFFFLV